MRVSNRDTTETVFVNTVFGQGVLNGVINLQLGTYLFTPVDAGQVDLDPIITCRLRMDRQCAEHLYDALGALLLAISQAESGAPGEESAATVN